MTRISFLTAGVFAAAAALGTHPLSAGEAPSTWSRFRGPNGQGHLETAGLPKELRLSSLAWKVRVPKGRSSVVVSSSLVFGTGCDGENLITYCLDARSGEERWRRAMPRPRKESHHRKNGPAPSTPATDGESVYVFFPDFGLLSFDREGGERWRVPLGPFSLPNGCSSSPILAKDLLVLQIDQDQDAYLLALDPKNGNERWRTPRPEAAHGYSTPVVFAPAEAPAQLIVTGSNQLISYVLETGEKKWWTYGLTWQVKPSAVVSADTIFVTGWAPGADPGERVQLPLFAEAIQTGDTDQDGKISEDEAKAGGWRHRGGWGLVDLDDDGALDERDWAFFRARRSAHNRTFAIRPPEEAHGDITDVARLWSDEKAVPVVASPLLYEGILYTLKDGGILTAFEAATGRVLKRARVDGAIDQYYASPIVANGRLYLVGENGKASVVEPGADWNVLSVSDLGESCYATPAVGVGLLYVRSLSHLFAFGSLE